MRDITYYATTSIKMIFTPQTRKNGMATVDQQSVANCRSHLSLPTPAYTVPAKARFLEFCPLPRLPPSQLTDRAHHLVDDLTNDITHRPLDVCSSTSRRTAKSALTSIRSPFVRFRLPVRVQLVHTREDEIVGQGFDDIRDFVIENLRLLATLLGVLLRQVNHC